ncbi:hypothetical protein BH09ACT3_BH09ACT3_16840 [soil metagenome]
MADVHIDFGKLARTRRDLEHAVRVFEDTERFSDAVAGTVGHSGLADTVQSFADSWNDRREDLIEQLTLVHDFVDAVHDSFVELDERLAKGVDPAQANADHTIDDLEQYYARREGN